MREFYSPRSVCVIGASADPARIGGRPIRYLKQAGFPGAIYPVNPNRAEIQGFAAFRSVTELPRRPDLAIVALPREGVVPAVAQCAALGIPAVTVFSSGFAETDAHGCALQAELADIARGSGTRILGPNANGTMAPASGLYACFTPLLERGLPRPGGVAIITQSAALGTYLLDRCRERGVGIALWAHTGNEVDVTLLDALAYAIEDEAVRTVLVTTEVLRDPQQLKSILYRAAERSVMLAVLQVGRSALGELAAASHTGALVAAQSRVTRSLFRQAGAFLGRSMQDLVDVAVARERFDNVAPARVGVLTPSGGIGIMLADSLEDAGVALPRLSPALQSELTNAAPFCHPANPVDVTAQIINEPDRFRRVLAALADSGEADVVITFIPAGSARDPLTCEVSAAARRIAETGGRVRLGVVGTLDQEAAALLADAGVAIWAEAENIGLALRALTRPRPTCPPQPVAAVATVAAALGRQLATAASKGILGENASKDLLRNRGLPVIADIAARTPEEAVQAAEELRYPVAVKLHAPGLAHKARAGGVRLGLASPAAVASAAADILALPAARQDADLLVEPMVTGLELFVGVTSTEDYGLLAVCGVGGGDVEGRRQVAYRWMTVTTDDVADMLAETGILPLLELTRSAEAAQRELHRILAGLADLMAEAGGTVRAIDLNPVMLGPGGTCTIVDALIELAAPTAASRPPELITSHS